MTSFPVTPGPSVSFIVPARNEAGTIQRIVDELPPLGQTTEIIFIENNSLDDTLAEIERVATTYMGPLRVRFASISCRGKVEAVMHGFDMARGDICIIYDADMTVPADEMTIFYDVVKKGRGFLANGSRLVFDMEKGSMRGLNYLGNKLFAFLLRNLLQQPLSDALCGTKAFWKEDLRDLKHVHARYAGLDPFGDFDLLLAAGLYGLTIKEIPVHYKARSYGATNIRRIQNGWSLLRMVFLASFDRSRFRSARAQGYSGESRTPLKS